MRTSDKSDIFVCDDFSVPFPSNKECKRFIKEVNQEQLSIMLEVYNDRDKSNSDIVPLFLDAVYRNAFLKGLYFQWVHGSLNQDPYDWRNCLKFMYKIIHKFDKHTI